MDVWAKNKKTGQIVNMCENAFRMMDNEYDLWTEPKEPNAPKIVTTNPVVVTVKVPIEVKVNPDIVDLSGAQEESVSEQSETEIDQSTPESKTLREKYKEIFGSNAPGRMKDETIQAKISEHLAQGGGDKVKSDES